MPPARQSGHALRRQAGARIADVVEALRPHGLALQNIASIREQAMGGFVQARSQLWPSKPNEGNEQQAASLALQNIASGARVGTPPMVEQGINSRNRRVCCSCAFCADLHPGSHLWLNEQQAASLALQDIASGARVGTPPMVEQGINSRNRRVCCSCAFCADLHPGSHLWLQALRSRPR